ncbi:hypothetical protein [Lacticaseibacillus baoqingensis]|nr:hypothetical protein [Lacticaseibacillus baoqingensis]
MTDYQFTLPAQDPAAFDVLDPSLYRYELAADDLAPIQQVAQSELFEALKQRLVAQVPMRDWLQQLLSQSPDEYVAQFSDYAKAKLRSGEWQLGMRKDNGQLYAVLKDAASGQTRSFVTLEKRAVQELGNLPELAALSHQLATITAQIQTVSQTLKRVEQGQYNDRFAAYYSARQLIITGLSAQDPQLRQTLLTQAVTELAQMNAQLMLSSRQDALTFTDPKVKTSQAKASEQLLRRALGYLDGGVSLSVTAYTALGESQPVLATLMNYRAFVDQVLLQPTASGRSLAWLIDNAHQGADGAVEATLQQLSTQIGELADHAAADRIAGGNQHALENSDL